MRKDRKEHTPLENYAAMNTPRTDANESITCKEGDPCIAPDFARQLETELQTMTALADRLAKALEACQEDSQELLAEHSWWINEPRCGYAGRYLEHKKRIAEAKKAIAAYETHKKGMTP